MNKQQKKLFAAMLTIMGLCVAGASNIPSDAPMLMRLCFSLMYVGTPAMSAMWLAIFYGVRGMKNNVNSVNVRGNNSKISQTNKGGGR